MWSWQVPGDGLCVGSPRAYRFEKTLAGRLVVMYTVMATLASRGETGDYAVEDRHRL